MQIAINLENVELDALMMLATQECRTLSEQVHYLVRTSLLTNAALTAQDVVKDLSHLREFYSKEYTPPDDETLRLGAEKFLDMMLAMVEQKARGGIRIVMSHPPINLDGVTDKEPDPTGVRIPEHYRGSQVTIMWKIFEMVAKSSEPLWSNQIRVAIGDNSTTTHHIQMLVRRGVFIQLEGTKRNKLVGLSGEAREQYWEFLRGKGLPVPA